MTSAPELSTGGKLSTALSKKTEMKRRKSPCTPLRGKAKGKETRPGCFSIPLRPRPRARGRYREAGAAADEIIETCFGTNADRGLWAYYCYHRDIETILEKARELKSRYRQGEIRNPVTAFQRWLQRNYKEAL